MKFNKIFLLFIILIIFIGCGLKTDPKSKDSFQINKPKSVSINNSINGILIKNTQKDYSLIVERAIRTTECLTPFVHIATITEKSDFMDTDVTSGTVYVYRAFNLDTELNINSSSTVHSITYNTPITVSKTESIHMDNTSIEITPTFSEKPLFYVVTINNKELMKTRKTSFKLLLENKLNNIVNITPYDKYNNKGDTFSSTFINKNAAVILSPQNVQYISGKQNTFITWDKISGAAGYRISAKEKLLVETTNNTFRYTFSDNESCLTLEISAFNQYYESAPTKLKICKQ